MPGNLFDRLYLYFKEKEDDLRAGYEQARFTALNIAKFWVDDDLKPEHIAVFPWDKDYDVVVKKLSVPDEEERAKIKQRVDQWADRVMRVPDTAWELIKKPEDMLKLERDVNKK